MIRVEGLVVRAGEFLLENVHFEVPTGGYAALMGKTGSGKTTLLEAIAGLKSVSTGRILMQGVDVTRSRPAERNLGYVPQDAALFSRMSVRDHLAFALVVRRWPRDRTALRVAELARLLEVEHLLDRTPWGLSG
ncbi:MAG: ATP-binding cassette domain-containing protein [Pirellulaceae bacterium]